MAELEEELSSTLHDAVAGREEIEVATFSEDEVITLGAISSRIAVLFGTRDMTAWMEEDEGGKQSSSWDIVSALSERGRLGYKEEEMVRLCSQFLPVLVLRVFCFFFVDGRASIADTVATYYVEGKRTYCN